MPTLSEMGIIGSFEGFIPGAKDIYNRGTWGSGYDSLWANTSVQYNETSNRGNRIILTSSSIQVYTKFYNEEPGQLRIGSPSKLINFSSYNTISTVISNTPDCLYSGYFYIRGSENNTIAKVTISKNVSSEQIYTINLSGINVVGYLDISPLQTLNKNATGTWYVHRVYFT